MRVEIFNLPIKTFILFKKSHSDLQKLWPAVHQRQYHKAWRCTAIGVFRFLYGRGWGSGASGYLSISVALPGDDGWYVWDGVGLCCCLNDMTVNHYLNICVSDGGWLCLGVGVCVCACVVLCYFVCACVAESKWVYVCKVYDVVKGYLPRGKLLAIKSLVGDFFECFRDWLLFRYSIV